MPEISRFYGIIILMFFGDHEPPHFHVRYSGYKAKVEIKTGEIMEGDLPRRALRLIQDWIEIHESELLDNFEKCRMRRDDWKSIEPLK